MAGDWGRARRVEMADIHLDVTVFLPAVGVVGSGANSVAKEFFRGDALGVLGFDSGLKSPSIDCGKPLILPPFNQLGNPPRRVSSVPLRDRPSPVNPISLPVSSVVCTTC